MSDLPPLEPGLAPFLAWVREDEGRYYEFYRVFDEHERLVRGRSFWITVPAEHEGAESVRAVFFDDLGRALGDHAPNFARFSTETVDPRRINGWFEAVHAPAVTGSSAAPSSEALMWLYTGARLDGDGWIATSGYVPNEGHDDEDLAREAAEMLEADRVILRDAAGRVISVRDVRGFPVEALDELEALLRADAEPRPATAAPSPMP